MDPNQTPQPAQQPLTSVPEQPKSHKKIFIIIAVILILLAIIGGGYFFLKSQSNVPDQTVAEEPAGSNCTIGINGNRGDNFCSNYHEPSSKCQPGLANSYSDGCTKSADQ